MMIKAERYKIFSEIYHLLLQLHWSCFLAIDVGVLTKYYYVWLRIRAVIEVNADFPNILYDMESWRLYEYISYVLSYSHTVTFRGLRFTTFPSPTFCPKFVRFCRMLGFSTFIATFCDVLLRTATYCPVIQRLRATVSLGIGTFSYVFTTSRYVFLRFSRFYEVITT